MPGFNGLGLHLGNLSRLSNAKSRSISPENFTGEQGRGGMATEGTGAKPATGLGQGWKVSPSVWIEPGETFTLADIEGPGAIQQIWMTPKCLMWRHVILRIYWDDQEQPSVECPAGDFFAVGWEKFAQVAFAGGVRQSRGAASIATGRCRSASARGSRCRTSATRRSPATTRSTTR